ncbi:FKBP-type peptidyl-prolyl cis-trans isomerase [Algibacter pacificus]|uniref:FKBP-type peptidyl-prolyl cis-trans isomerase n=1 Tax=Algibacter pacificus TaxID=2599389 RepID=UPI0011C96431|nr:FKBP-type peptidyl-prolyl cis-trans isomerase [Algibacter pacificus]
MSLRKISFLILSLVLVFSACKKDDDADDIVTVELEDRTEQQAKDNDSLVKYFKNHYFNASDFGAENGNPKIGDLVITELTENATVPEGHILLNDLLEEDDPAFVLEAKSVVYAETDYVVYILHLNEGGGAESPHFCDDVRVRYEGTLLDGSVFDSAVTPVNFDLTTLIPAWGKVLPSFNTAETISDSTDGTIAYTNHGAGVMFVPSGLGYFANFVSDIPSYSPIVFKFDLLQTTVSDHDLDGVPSYMEDLYGDGEFTVNNDDLEDDTDDDTDGDGTPDYLDTDDDGDGVFTIYEDIDEDGDPTNDIGANGIAKYLDPTETESNN